MIIYENRLNHFINDVAMNNISDILANNLREKHLSGGAPSEINAWNNSLHFMKDVLQCKEIPADCKVAIEYNIPQTSKRVDFMILGADKQKKDHIVIVELKQWAQVQKVDDWAKHSVLSDLRSHQPTAHPSYQAFSYKSLILNYCDMQGLNSDSLNPCAYLHNLSESYRPVLEAELYSDWIREAPVFLKSDVLKLRSFIQRYVTAKSSDDEMLYNIDFGRLKPTKSLQDSLDSMLCGNEEFRMIDEQAVAYDFIMESIRKTQKDNRKHVIIIQGGPGTGKSVLAINVLADCIRKLQLNASYITKNSAPRNCYTKLLSKGNARKEMDLKLAISSPFVLPNIPENGLDVGIFDEAHRMVRVSFILSSLPQEYHVINDVIIPDQVTDPSKKYTTQIDHVVVSPYGVFVIETKNYDGWILGAEETKKWKQTFKTTPTQSFYNPIKQNWGHTYALAEHLKLATSWIVNTWTGVTLSFSCLTEESLMREPALSLVIAMQRASAASDTKQMRGASLTVLTT